MFNLLPEIEKKLIVSEYNVRRTIVALIFLFIIGLIAVISIIPSYILSSSKVSEVSKDISAIRQSSVFEEEKQLNSDLSKTNAKISTLYSVERGAYIGDLFEKVLSHKTADIRINGIGYHTDSKESWISLGGVAQSREVLSFFIEDMKKNPLFEEVNIPVSDFAKDRNARFTVDILGDF